MIKFMKLLILVFISALFMQSCEYEWIEPDDAGVPDVISYADHIQPIFDKGCNTSGCHTSGGPSPDLSPDISYDALFSGGYINVDNPESSSLYTIVRFGSMQVYAQAGDAAYILKWIEQGALNN